MDPPAKGKIVATYDYVDEKGSLLYQIVRYDPKFFWDRRPDGSGGWIWNLGNVRLVLYRLSEVVKAETVLIFEGEKDVDTAYRAGLPAGFAATSSPLGAGQWRSEYSESLRGKRVIICPDNDKAGMGHMKQVIRDLTGKAAEIRRIVLPGSVKDFSEWVEAGAAHGQFTDLVRQAETINYEQMREAGLGKEKVAGRVL
jgi:DNA primase